MRRGELRHLMRLMAPWLDFFHCSGQESTVMTHGPLIALPGKQAGATVWHTPAVDPDLG